MFCIDALQCCSVSVREIVTRCSLYIVDIIIFSSFDDHLLNVILLKNLDLF